MYYVNYKQDRVTVTVAEFNTHLAAEKYIEDRDNVFNYYISRRASKQWRDRKENLARFYAFSHMVRAKLMEIAIAYTELEWISYSDEYGWISVRPDRLLDENNVGAHLSVFCRFEQPQNALGMNRNSGKWNHHYGDGVPVKEAYRDLISMFRMARLRKPSQNEWARYCKERSDKGVAFTSSFDALLNDARKS